MKKDKRCPNCKGMGWHMKGCISIKYPNVNTIFQIHGFSEANGYHNPKPVNDDKGI